jgi:hypothetical protein
MVPNRLRSSATKSVLTLPDTVAVLPPPLTLALGLIYTLAPGEGVYANRYRNVSEVRSPLVCQSRK